GTLTYTTGISGTQGVETTNADGTTNPNDTQNIVVNTSSATLNINGAGGVDKFNIEASSFTKTLTIAGNLGTVPNYEEAKNNYDSVRIDLSKTSGVDLNISNLLVSNPNDEGIIITASKGADNITLVAGANHDVIEFNAGGGTSAQSETYEVALGNLRLYAGESLTIDGVTIVNTGSDAINAYTIADAFAKYVAAGYVTPTTSTKIVTNAAGTSSISGNKVALYGEFESLTGDWSGATVDNGSSGAYTNTLTFTNSKVGNVKDLNLQWNANSLIKTADSDLPTIKAFSTTHNATQATTQRTKGDGTINPSEPAATAFGNLPANTTHTFVYGNGDNTIQINVNAKSAINDLADFFDNVVVQGKAFSGATTSGSWMEISVNGGAATKYEASSTSNKFTFSSAQATEIKSAFDNLLPDGLTLSVGSRNPVGAKVLFFNANPTTTNEATLTFQHFMLTGSTSKTMSDTEIYLKPAQESSEGLIQVEFKGLLAGQSYSFNGKTVIATQDLSAEDVAYAFAYAEVGANAGFVITSDFTKAKIDVDKVFINAEGATLTIQDQNPDKTDASKLGISATAEDFVTGTKNLAFVDKAMSASTTQQGFGDN
ncbi:MAG: hypothetical protein K2N70_05760, partial [Helicobacter sp.]|nr:hypothetical protein [Helicobacter sp.]